ncbi:MAG: hypothetical protein PVI20_19475 [Desulfobacteraceae bacterium]
MKRRIIVDLWEPIERRRTIPKFSVPPTERQLERLLQAGAKGPFSGEPSDLVCESGT